MRIYVLCILKVWLVGLLMTILFSLRYVRL